jgi:small-conductance mechanosensitive channel
MAGQPAHRLRSRTVALVERRTSLVRLLIALFVARMVVTVTEVIESSFTVFSAVITAAIGLEAWRAWRVRRAAQAQPERTVAPPPDTVWNRVLLPLERRGPAILYVLSAVYAVGFAAVLVADGSSDVLLDVAVISREVITFLFLGVLVAGYLSVRDHSLHEPG